MIICLFCWYRSANLNGGDIPLPALKAQPDPGANFIMVGDSLTEYLNGLGFVLDEDSNLYKVCFSVSNYLRSNRDFTVYFI